VNLDVEFARLIEAAPEEVFDAFTSPEGQEAFSGRTIWGGSSGRSATCASRARPCAPFTAPAMSFQSRLSNLCM
jgi:hypothetical protein